ncbi:MAG: hypothetical protein OEM67_13525 [Thermoleophilia bacterium]|nr:hypothetical protein [Thermoleophilia bacterium]MDH3725198.1 hypothetical protein [Thermoleophilia bacterium]
MADVRVEVASPTLLGDRSDSNARSRPVGSFCDLTLPGEQIADSRSRYAKSTIDPADPHV